jgi:hypothetical protein
MLDSADNSLEMKKLIHEINCENTEIILYISILPTEQPEYSS